MLSGKLTLSIWNTGGSGKTDGSNTQSRFTVTETLDANLLQNNQTGAAFTETGSFSPSMMALISDSFSATETFAGDISAGFNPTSLFAGGKAGIFYDTANLSSLFQDRSATPSTPAVVDGVVGTRKDLSGNGNHQIATADAKRPILRTASGLYWLEYDLADDVMSANSSIASIGTSAAVFFGCAVSNAGASVLVQSVPNAGTGYTGVLASGDSNVASDPTGTTFNVDGSSVVGTRAALFTAIASASGNTPHLFESRTTDVSTSPYTATATGFYSGFPNTRRDYGLLIISETNLGSNQAALRTWFGTRLGLTL
jgi:hypothetical protein